MKSFWKAGSILHWVSGHGLGIRMTHGHATHPAPASYSLNVTPVWENWRSLVILSDRSRKKKTEGQGAQDSAHMQQSHKLQIWHSPFLHKHPPVSHAAAHWCAVQPPIQTPLQRSGYKLDHEVDGPVSNMSCTFLNIHVLESPPSSLWPQSGCQLGTGLCLFAKMLHPTICVPWASTLTYRTGNNSRLSLHLGLRESGWYLGILKENL